MASNSKAWRIIPRPLLETVLNNHAQHHTVPQPLIVHGPRGTGKTTLFQHRLLEEWNKGPHVTGYVDFAENIKEHHPLYQNSYPWTSWSNCKKPPLHLLQTQLETCLESLAQKGISLGSISSHQIFKTMHKWHSLNTSLSQILKIDQLDSDVSKKELVKRRGGNVSTLGLWDKAVFALSGRLKDEDIDGVSMENGKLVTREESSYYKEAYAALKLAKEVIRVQQGWRKNAVADLNRKGGYSRSLVNSATDWPCLLLELLSAAAELDFFQPKLVINNVDILRHAMLVDDSTICGAMYHDSLIWRMIALGANERSLPVILVSSDSYYSYRAFMDFGFPDIFISRENFGWTPQEAKMHMVADYFSSSEWTLVAEVLGPNPRHLFELYALKQSNVFQKIMDDDASTFEDIVDAYLAHLQVTVVNPALNKALDVLQKFAADVRNGKISKDKLRFGAPWRHPPHTDNPSQCSEWAKIQLIDFVQCLVNAEFGVNYLADCSLEIFDDPCALAMIEVGLLYAQRDPSIIRPVSRGIQRCLVRWLVHERMKMNVKTSVQYLWQRIFRGRSYRHLMLQIGYK